VRVRLKELLVVVQGLFFKGTGFYLTDYGKSGTSKKPESTPTESTKKGR